VYKSVHINRISNIKQDDCMYGNIFSVQSDILICPFQEWITANYIAFAGLVAGLLIALSGLIISLCICYT